MSLSLAAMSSSHSLCANMTSYIKPKVHTDRQTHTASLFISSGDTWPKIDLNPNLPDPILTLTDTEEGILQTGDVVR